MAGMFDDLVPGGQNSKTQPKAESGPWDSYKPAKQSESGPWSEYQGGAFDDLVPKSPEKSSLARRLIGDTAVSAVKGAIGLTEVPVGIADMATGGMAGKALEGIGYRPKEAKAMLDEMYSPEQKAANQAVSEAEGFFGTAKTALQNPSTIGQSVIESAPLLLPGAAIARGVGAAGKIAPVVAGGIGEGVVGAGLAAEQMRQNSEDGTLSARQTGAALASGAGTAAFGIAGGKLAQSAIGKKLGLADVDTALAMSPAQRAAAGGIDAGLAKRIAGGAVSEGVLEELPQSMWEQAAQNYGEGKPIGEGVAEAGAMGALAGGVMGGGFNALPGRMRGTVEQQPPAPAQEAPRALPAPTYTGTPNDQTMAAEVERANQVAAAQANADALYAERAAFEQERAPAKLPVTGPMSAAVNVGIDSGATSITSPANPRYEIPAQPRGSFAQQSEFADLINQERADVADRRELAQLVGQERRDQERRIAEAADSRRALDAALADTNQRAAGVAAQESEAARLRLLDNILSGVSDTGNPARQFGNALRRAGYQNTDFTERERQVIQRFSDARAALRSPEATTVPAAPNELDAASLGIRERSTAGAMQGASGRDKIGEAVSLLSQGWKLALNKTLVSPTGKRRKLNAEEFAAVREARAKMINKTEAGNAATQVDAVSDQGRGDVAAGGIGNAQPVRSIARGRSGNAGTPAPGMRAAGAVGNASGAGSALNAAELEQVAQEAAQADGAQAAPAGGQVAIKNAEAAPAGAQQQQKEPKNGMQEGRRQEEVAANQLQAEAAPKPANQTQIKRSSPIMRRDDLVGAIMRVTGGNGIAANMAQTIIGDKANQATKVRGLFQNAGTMDLDDTADLLRTQEGYDVRDGNHLAELIREQAAGNSVVSMERAERDAADNAEKEYRAAVNERAASMGLKRSSGKRTLQMVEADIARVEAEIEAKEREISDMEAREERAAIQAESVYDEIFGADLNESDWMTWLSANVSGTYTQEEIDNVDRIQADREDARAAANADGAADIETQAGTGGRQGFGANEAQPGGTEGRARGAAEGFSLTGQTNDQAAEQFAQQQAGENDAPTKAQADRERDAVPFSMQQQSQPKPQGVQTGLFTADGRAANDAEQPKISGNRRNPAKVNIFNPYEDGDIVSIGGKDWQVKNDGGWYLTTTGNWRGEHPTIKKIAAMTDLIAMVEKEAAAEAAPADPKESTAELSKPADAGDQLDAAKIRAGYAHRSLGGLGDKVKMEQGWFDNASREFSEKVGKDAESDEQKALADKLLADFKDEYKARRYRVMEVGAGVVSSAVAGRNNFNSAQAGRRGSALDRAEQEFTDWQKGAIESGVRAIRAARSPEQIAAEQQAKADKAAKKKASLHATLGKFLDFKKGDDLRFGKYQVARVSLDKAGYPSSFTVDATDLTDNKFDIARILFDGDKEKLRAAVDEIRASRTVAETAQSKEPWQMTRKEWYAAKNNDRAETFGPGGKRSGAAETIARIERKARLNYGVEENGDPVDHRQVIEKALAEGKPVPQEVLSDYPGIALQEPSTVYTAEQRTRRDEYTKDLFGQDLPDANRQGFGAGRQQPAAATVRNVVAAAIVPGEYATVAEPRKTGEIKSAFAQVGSAGQAAHVLAGMRKLPQEHFAVLVLDKDSKPISVLKLFAGATAQTNVYPEVVAKAVYETPGAASVWFAHNHPSGKAEPSDADELLTAALSKPFGAGTGIEVAGHVVIAQTRYVEMDSDGYKIGADAAIPAGARTNSIPVTERVFRKVGTMGMAITSPAMAKREVARVAGGKTGVVFVNSQNEPTGFLPLSSERMQKLRDYEDQSGAKLLFGAAARSNASSAFVHFDDDVKSGDAIRAAENIYQALNGNGIKVLDAFYRDDVMGNGVVSMSERKMIGWSPARNFESRAASQRPWYFSPLAKAFEMAKPESMPAGMWKSWLSSNSAKLGVKQDEIQWSGINDWLELRGKEKTAKADIIAYINGNGVKVNDVMKKAGSKVSKEEIDAAALRGDWDVYDRLMAEQDNQQEYGFDTRGNTKYGDYTLPGGENYRELLLTLPSAKNLDDLALSRFGKDYLRLGEADKAAIRDEFDAQRSKQDYRSSHWTEPNILAHVRFNDRTDADGNKVLFIEELQSDWGQDGKKKGFDAKPPASKKPSQEERDALLRDMRQKAKAEIIKRTDGGIDEAMAAEIVSKQPMSQVAEWAGLSAAWQDLIDREWEWDRFARNPGVPSAPFVTDTKSWLSLGLKRMIAYAVENGYDKVAFVNGQQSADRYDLSKQVDEIRYQLNGQDTWQVEATKGGNVVWEDTDATLSTIENTVGKEIAQKIRNGEGALARGKKTLSGLDLKVGGEGMKAFYDQIVPQVANDVLRKLGGGKVDKVQIGGLSQIGFSVTDAIREKAMGGLPLFSKSAGKAPINAQQKFALNIVQKTADKFRAEYAGAAALDIRVVYSRDEIPERYRPSPYAEGVYHDREGIIYLVASNLPTRQRAWQVLVHETVGHYGMANMMGDQFSSLWETVLKRAVSSQPLNRNPQPGEANYETVDAVRRLYPEASDAEVAQEVLARMAETMPNVGWFRMAMARIRVWLKNAAKAFGLKLEPTMADVRRLVELAGYHVRSGANLERSPVGQDAVFASQREAMQSKIPAMDDYQKRADQLDRAFTAMGLVSRRESSRVSQSEYVEVQDPNDDSKTYKIRVSNHQLPNGYKQPDFDVIANEGRHGGHDWNKAGTWVEAVEWLAGKIGVPVPATVKSVRSLEKTNAKKAADRDAIKAVRFAEQNLAKFETSVSSGAASARKSGSGEWIVVPGSGLPISLGKRPGVAFSPDAAIEMARDKLRSYVIERQEKAGIAPTPDSAKLGFNAPVDAGMQERTVRAVNPGSSEPAQSFSGAGSNDNVQQPDSVRNSFESRSATIGRDESIIDQMRNAGRRMAGSAWSVSEPSKMDDLIYSLQDKQVDLKRVIQSIAATGKKIGDDINAYLQEELFHGRSAKGVKDFLDFELRPLLREMQMLGIDMGDFEEYLWNRHAEERNNQIAKINPDMPDGGSGINTADARAYLAELSADQKRKMEALAARIDQMNRNSQRILVESGLEKQETIDAWNGAYQHYVPLQREDVDTGHTGTGKGFSIRGSSSKRAMGSGKKVVDIIANLTQQRERNIVRAEKNRVSNALFGLAAQNPNPDFWKVDEAPKERVVKETAIYTVLDADGNKIDEFTRMDEAERLANKTPGATIDQSWADRVTERIVPGFKNRDNVILTRIDGEDHYVILNERDDRAMRLSAAMKNLDMDNMGRALSVVGKATRYLASVNTQYNPVFGVINLIRDVQGALLNLQSTQLAGEQKRVAGYTVDALRGIYADIRAHRRGEKPSSKWAELFEEFQKEGGQTGYRDQYANAEARAEAIMSELNQFKEGKLKLGARAVFGWLSDYNETMENAVRLAAYKTAKEKGLSNQQAASIAKNLTVNFNRKGQATTQIGALYAFFNASVQGTARIAETLFENNDGDANKIRLSKLGKRIISGGIMLGSMQAMLLAAAGFDDDEPPEFVRERNLILPTGDGKYLTLAMPLGFHVIPGIGRIATEFALSGFKDPAKRIVSMFGMLAETFNPVGSSGFSIQTLTPSVVDPFAALAENRDFTGREIYRENFSANDPAPGNTRAKDVATPWSRYLSESINFITGGTEFKPGAFSPSPDAIDYLIAQATGGVGREINKAAQTVGAAYTGDDLPLYKIPLVGRFVGDTEGQSGTSQKFYGAIREINAHEREVNGLRESGRVIEAQEYIADNPVYRMRLFANLVENQVRKLRDARRKASDDGDSDRVRAINDQITRMMTEFNERALPLINQSSTEF